MSIPTKTTRKFKIRKTLQPKPSIPDSPKQISLKIARKLSSPNPSHPLFSSIQEDFIFENEANPFHFLSPRPESPKFEVISEARSLSPNIVGPRINYSISQIKSEIRRSTNKYHLNFSRISSNPHPPSLEEKLLEREKTFKQLSDRAKNIEEKIPEKNLIKQTKSLENFEKNSAIWQKIEQNIADTLSKHPEDLRLNSGKLFALKKKEADVIERFNRINEISDREYWKNSLRQDHWQEQYFKHGSDKFKQSLNLKKQQQDQFCDKSPIAKKKTLKGSEYFHEKLKVFNKFTDDLNIDQETEFLVKGTDKIKLEFEAAKRIGKQFVNLPPMEPYTEQVLYKQYDAKSYY